MEALKPQNKIFQTEFNQNLLHSILWPNNLQTTTAVSAYLELVHIGPKHVHVGHDLGHIAQKWGGIGITFRPKVSFFHLKIQA